jgi:hypothetical protein
LYHCEFADDRSGLRMTRLATSTGNLMLAVVLTGAGSWLSCGGAASEADAARAAQWQAIESEHAALEELRAQLATARERNSMFAPQLEPMIGDATDQFLERLVGFINEHAGPGQGNAPKAREVEAAIRMKSAEDLLLAREHIDRGGDYAKAIDILTAALVVDPGNRDIEAARDEAARLRYMDAERFGRVEKGMGQDEVRAELGQVQQQNIRQPAEGQVVWLYPRQGGAAAAVFFRAEPDGALVVDDTLFDAVASTAARPVDGTAPQQTPAARQPPAPQQTPAD